MDQRKPAAAKRNKNSSTRRRMLRKKSAPTPAESEIELRRLQKSRRGRRRVGLLPSERSGFFVVCFFFHLFLFCSLCSAPPSAAVANRRRRADALLNQSAATVFNKARNKNGEPRDWKDKRKNHHTDRRTQKLGAREGERERTIKRDRGGCVERHRRQSPTPRRPSLRVDSRRLNSS